MPRSALLLGQARAFGFRGSCWRGGEVLGTAGGAGDLAEMAAADRERAARRLRARETGGGRLGWPERRRAVIAATVFARGFGKPTCCQISAPIIFFQNKRRYFCTVNLHLGSLPPPRSLSHMRTFSVPWGILAAQGLTSSLLPPPRKLRGSGMLSRCRAAGQSFPHCGTRQKPAIHPSVIKPKAGLWSVCFTG